MTEGRHVVIVVAMTFVAGMVDALGYLRWGHVFIANMTGNLVLMAVEWMSGHFGDALRSVLALLGFIMGAWLVSWQLRGRFAKVTWSFMGEAACLILAGLLLSFSVSTAVFFGAMAMGGQSRVARHLNIAGVATTVVTSTLTQVVADGFHRWRERDARVRLGVFGAYGIGALVAAWGRAHAGWIIWGAVVLIMVCWWVSEHHPGSVAN